MIINTIKYKPPIKTKIVAFGEALLFLNHTSAKTKTQMIICTKYNKILLM